MTVFSTSATLSTLRLAVLPLALLCATPVFAADDPTMHQVFLAAQAGKYEEAQAMMDKVLRDHPNSAEAHYVEAQLLARQGRMIEAAPELAKAEKIAPGLPFAKADAVSKLRARIEGSAKSLSPASPAPVMQTPAAVAPRAAYSQREAAPREGGGIPWGMIFVIGIVGIIAYVIMSRRKAAAMNGGGFGGGAGGGGGAPFIPSGPSSGGFGNSAQPPYPNYGGGMPMGGQQAPGMGMGSRIAGGLATGAAVGAGIVAGEALMHHFTDRDSGGGNSNHANADTPAAPGYAPAQPDDMGGNDFGVADSGSWDDGGGGGGGGGGSDDWN